jgi:hypothetical protein
METMGYFIALVLKIRKKQAGTIHSSISVVIISSTAFIKIEV